MDCTTSLRERSQDAAARFEFRVWSGDLHDVLLRLMDLAEPGAMEKSSATYILSGDDRSINAKIRDGKLDIKQLVEIRERLELWRPCLTCRFPLPGDMVRRELACLLSFPRETANLESYDLENFVREIITPDAGLRTAAVDKWRLHFAWHDVLGEYTHVHIRHRPCHTVAVESLRPDAVLVAMAELGIDDRDNVNYPDAIRSVLGLTSLQRREGHRKEDAMTPSKEAPTQLELLLDTIEQALAANPSLTDERMDDVRRMKQDVVRHYEEGHAERASRAAELCLRMIRQGEAVKE